jgi:hypothetical protein
MRTIIDRNGIHWNVEESSTRYGVGARGPGEPLPEPLSTTVVFHSADGQEVVKDISAGALDKMTEADLIDLLEKPPE